MAIVPLAIAFASLASATVAQEQSEGRAQVTRIRGRAAGLVYEETLVGGAQVADALPLVIALHQLGAGPRGASRVFARASDCPARIVAPRGPLRHPPGFSFIDAYAADPAEVLVPELRRGADRLARFIAEIRRERPTVGTPIVTGFSQGGIMTFALAALHPESVGIALPAAGTLPRPLWPEASPDLPPILAFHGARDTIVPISGARAAIEHVRRLGRDAQLVVYPNAGHRFTREMRRALSLRVSAEVRARGHCSI